MARLKIMFRLCIISSIVFLPIVEASGQAKTSPKQSKEAILEWLCQKIEENYSDQGFTSGEESFLDMSSRTVKACKITGSNIQIKFSCYDHYDNLQNWKKEENDKFNRRDFSLLKQYSVFWNRNVEIPIDKIKEVKIIEPSAVHLNHQYELVVYTKSDYIEVSEFNTDFSKSNDTQNNWWDESAERNRFEGNSSRKTYTIKLKKDPALKERIEKALIDLNTYFDNKEPY
jgi:hypothetical protein